MKSIFVQRLAGPKFTQVPQRDKRAPSDNDVLYHNYLSFVFTYLKLCVTAMTS